MIIDLRQDPEWMKDRLSELFGKYLLEDVILQLNKACCEWRNGRLRPELDFLKKVEAGNPIFYWAVAETARHAILWCPQASNPSVLYLRRYERIDRWEPVEQLMRAALDAQMTIPFVGSAEARRLLNTESPLNSIARVFYAQLSFERVGLVRSGQALLMYDEAPRRLAARGGFPYAVYLDVLTRVLGVDLQQFVAALLHIMINSLSDRPGVSHALAPLVDSKYDEVFLGRSPELDILQSGHAAVLNLLSADQSEIRAWMAGGSDRILTPERVFSAPNPLFHYPLVRCIRDRPDCCIAPVPHLIGEWLYEPLAARLRYASENHSIFTTNRLAAIFEEYVGLISEICDPERREWLPEVQLKVSLGQRARVVDWAAEFRDAVILVDAKRCDISQSMRYTGLDADWANYCERWAEGVNQATDFWGSVQKQGLTPLYDARHKQPLVVIVTHGDADFVAHRIKLAPYLCPNPIPSVIISIDQFERMMTKWNQEDGEWLPKTLFEIHRRGAAEVFGIGGLPSIGAGPLWERCLALVKRAEQVTERGTDTPRGCRSK